MPWQVFDVLYILPFSSNRVMQTSRGVRSKFLLAWRCGRRDSSGEGSCSHFITWFKWSLISYRFIPKFWASSGRTAIINFLKTYFEQLLWQMILQSKRSSFLFRRVSRTCFSILELFAGDSSYSFNHSFFWCVNRAEKRSRQIMRGVQDSNESPAGTH